MSFAGEDWALPGPARYARTVRASLDRGFSTVCVVPDHLLTDGAWADGLSTAADIAVDLIVDQPDRPPASVLHGYMQLDPALAPVGASDLAGDERLHGRIFQIALADPGRRKADWARFLMQFVAGVRSVAVGDRPRFLVVCSHVVADSFTEPNLLLDRHWWWGVVGRVDTTIHVSQMLGDRSTNTLLTESIVEVVGYDLETGHKLADSWSGAIEELPALLPMERSIVAAADVLHYGNSTHDATPPYDVREAWDAGALDHWDRYETFMSPRFLDGQTREETLQTRIWRAQLREFMPLIDEERQRLERWIKTVPLESEPEYPLEIGPLSYLLRYDAKARLQTSKARRDAAEWLRKARNFLAHRTTLRADFIADGRRLLDADRSQSDSARFRRLNVDG